MSQPPFHFHDHLADAGPTLRSWLRETFAPAGLWAIFRTLVWLVPLTILVWFYAARSILAVKPQSVAITVRSGDPARKVTLQDDSRRLTVTINGAQARVDALIKTLEESGEIPIVLEGTPSLGQQSQPAKPLLTQTEPFRSSRVAIQSVSPPNIELFVDEFAERTVPIRVPKALEGKVAATFEPSDAVIRAPARDIKAAEENAELFVEADLASLPEIKAPGKKDPIIVSLRSPLGVVAEVRPKSATAALDVASDDVTFELKSVTVFASLPQSFLNNNKVTINPEFVSNVKVTGPQEQIQILQGDGFRPKARLDFTPGELSDATLGKTVPKRPVFELPPGVRVVEPDGNPITVEWSVTRREGGI